MARHSSDASERPGSTDRAPWARPRPSGPPQISIVVPTYRGEATLEELIHRVRETLRARGLTFEILLVDDASPDGAWRVLERLVSQWPELRAIELLGNEGQYRATLCGLAHADGEIIVTLDDDLEHPPEEIPRLLDALHEDPDLDAVIGTWESERAAVRNLGTRIHRWVNHVAYGSPRQFHHTAFRAIRRPVVDAMAAHRTRNPVVSALLWQATSRVANVRVEHRERQSGRSGFRFRFGVGAVLRNLFQASTAPLRLLALLGLGAAVLAVVGMMAVLGRWWIFGVDPPPGWASVFLATMFFGGSILVGLGLIGEYIALIVSETRGRPRWSIRSEISTGSSSARRPEVVDVDRGTFESAEGG